MRKRRRPISAILALAGMAVLAWLALTLVWGEPWTALEATRAQAALRAELARENETWRLDGRPDSPREIRTRAAAYQDGLRPGDPLGRIVVPRLGLSTVVVEGTAGADLERGPGHYRNTNLPGAGGTVAIAGHRTTYLQPFRHIDDLQAGDTISLQTPYGTFPYVVYARAIVDDRDWSILRERAFEKLVLTACHPLYSAERRIAVFARLRR